MSASLVYLSLKPEEPKGVGVSAVQVRANLEKLYGNYPIKLTHADIPALRVLEQLDGSRDNPWTALIALIQAESVGIKLWEEY